jgi:hypothetical protein
MEMAQSEDITVRIKIPRALHAFVEKLAVIEGSKSTDFYELWIRTSFQANLDDCGTLFDMDVERIIEHNGLTGIVKEKEETRKLWVPREIYDDLSKQAEEHGLSVDEYVDKRLKETHPDIMRQTLEQAPN